MTDPRAFSEEVIVPPAPLPHVSRRALKRIGDDAAPIATQCHYCNGELALVSNKEIYGRECGDWPYAYLCRGCGAYVGLHPNTDIPLGTVADRALREARKVGKTAFLGLKHLKGWSRKEAYAWLREKLELPAEKCHWGMFDIETCQKSQWICAAEINNCR